MLFRIQFCFYVLLFLGVSIVTAGLPSGKDETRQPQQDSSDQIRVNVESETLADAVRKNPQLDEMRLKALGIDLKTVDAKTIERMETFKLATPDKDADVLGGTMKVRMQPRYERDSLRVNSRYQSTYFEKAREAGSFFQISMDQATRKHSAHRLGYSLGLIYDRDVIAKEQVNRDWILKTNESGESIFAIDDVVLEQETSKRQRYALSAGIDYELTPDSFVYLKGDMHMLDRYDLTHQIKYEYETEDYSEFDAVSGSNQKGWITRVLEDRIFQNTSESFSGGFLQENDVWENEFQFQFKRKVEQWKERWDSFFEQKNVAIAYDAADEEVINIYALDEAQANNSEAYEFDELKLTETEDRSTDIILNVDSVRFWEFSNGSFRVKGGAKYFSRKYDRWENRKIYYEYEDDFSLTSVLGDWESVDFADNAYTFGLIQDTERVRSFYEDNQERFVYDEADSRSQSDPANYDVIESVYSVYAMSDIRWDVLRLVAGIRAEKTSDEFHGNEVLLDEEGDYVSTVSTDGARSYQYLFPGIHFSYKVRPELTFYTSWSKALRRPKFSYLAPFRKVVPRSKFISEGNPELQPAVYTNYLVAADYSYSSRGFLSMELMRRTYENLVVRQRFDLHEGVYAGYEKETWINVGSGDLYQLDLRWRQHLDGVFVILEGLSFEVRYTYAKSETNSREDEIEPLVNTPSHRMKTSLMYRSDRWEIIADYNYRSSYLDQLGDQKEKDRYYAPHSTVDLSVEYNTHKRVTGIIEVENLTREVNWNYLGGPKRPMNFKYLGRVWKAGLRFRY